MIFGYLSPKEAKELAKKEYLRGATATATLFKEKELEAEQRRRDERFLYEREMEALELQKQLILNDWNTLKEAKKEMSNTRDTIFVESLKEIFNTTNNQQPTKKPSLLRNS